MGAAGLDEWNLLGRYAYPRQIHGERTGAKENRRSFSHGAKRHWRIIPVKCIAPCKHIAGLFQNAARRKDFLIAEEIVASSRCQKKKRFDSEGKEMTLVEFSSLKWRTILTEVETYTSRNLLRRLARRKF